MILWQTSKTWANQGSKTLDHLTTNYLFIGWRPRISCSVLLLLVATGSLVTSARSLWTDSEFVNSTEPGVRRVASEECSCSLRVYSTLSYVCWAELFCHLCVRSLSGSSPQSLRRTLWRGNDTVCLCFLSYILYSHLICLGESVHTHGLNIKDCCQTVKRRLCFVSDLQTSSMSTEEMDCSVL